MNIKLALYDDKGYQCDMTALEFKSLQERIGCSGAQIARWLELSPLTVTRYRNGDAPIPGPVALAMNALASGWRP